MIKLYGIKNCDTVKKARHWLEQNDIIYQFHDFRQNKVDTTQIKKWIESIGAEGIINKRSTSWRQLSEKDKNNISNTTLNKLLTKNMTLIKRPLLEHNDQFYVGFSETNYKKIFSI